MAAPLRDDLEIEEPVIAAIRMGDRYAFEEFLRRHESWVRSVIYSVAGRADGVDDVAQAVWTTFWQRIGDLREPRSWRTWLYRLARNAAVDAGRRLTRTRNVGAPDWAHLPVPAVAGETVDSMARRESVRAARAAIEGLPAIYREPFVLRHVNDWTYQQIAEVMGLPIDTVETRLVRARRLLRETLAHQIERSDVARG